MLSTFGFFMCPPTHPHARSAHTMISYYCIIHKYIVVLCIDEMYVCATDCTLVMHPLHYGFSPSNAYREQAAGCVLTSPPRSVDVKSYFQNGSYLIFCFALDFHSLCPHTLQHWVLALYGNYHVPGIYTCTNETTLVSIIHEIRSAGSW